MIVSNDKIDQSVMNNRNVSSNPFIFILLNEKLSVIEECEFEEW